MLISIMVFSRIPPFWSSCEERTGYESSASIQRSIPYFTMACNQEYSHTLPLIQWIRRVTLGRTKTSKAGKTMVIAN